jgi:hypothetical protein
VHDVAKQRSTDGDLGRTGSGIFHCFSIIEAMKDATSPSSSPELKLPSVSGALAAGSAQPTQVEMGPKEGRQWNTKNLPQRLLADTASAACAAALVAPVISMVDR